MERTLASIIDTQRSFQLQLNALSEKLVNYCSPVRDNFHSDSNTKSHESPEEQTLPPPSTDNSGSSGNGPLPLKAKLRNLPLILQKPPETLHTIDDVISTNSHFLDSSSPGTLAQILARDAVFGEEVMALCTPHGSIKWKALPRHGLYTIKKIMFKYFPQ